MSTFSNMMNRPKLLFASICILTLSSAACTNQAETDLRGSVTPQVTGDTLLNSERIRMKFGNYGVEVLFSDSTTRIANLYSGDEDIKITRTYAVVLYPSIIDTALIDEHNAILAGGSIGQVFKEGGWSVQKQSIHFGRISPTVRYRTIYEMMGGIDPSELAMYLYKFSVEKDGRNYEYATIAEIYHPDYLIYRDLSSIYESVETGEITTSELTKKLDMVHRFMTLDWIESVQFER